MNQLDSLNIAVVGNESLVNLMRFGGVEHYKTIEPGIEEEEMVQTAVRAFINTPQIGIIMIPERYSDYVSKIRYYLREKKRTTPVIINVPSAFEDGELDVKQFYQTLTKKLIGFTVEL